MIAERGRVLSIRRARLGDLDRVALIEQASFSDPWTLETFASSLALPHLRFLVAEEVEQSGEASLPGAGGGAPLLLGYVVALLLGEEGEIADLAVAPSARRRGIGGQLLDRISAEAALSGVRAMYLEVRESNAGALALYESRGFGAVGRRRGYYRNPSEDALLLRRELGPS